MNKILISLILLLVLGLSACGAQKIYLCADGSTAGGQQAEGKNIIYVCPDGSETKNVLECTFDKLATISSKEANLNAINFVNGYVRTSGWTATLINAYKDGGNYKAQIVISKQGEQSYETTVIIDGRKGTAQCDENCFYTAQIG